MSEVRHTWSPWLPSSLMMTQAKHKNIYRNANCLRMLSRGFCFNLTDPSCIYYGFQVWVFMEFLCVQMCVYLHLCVFVLSMLLFLVWLFRHIPTIVCFCLSLLHFIITGFLMADSRVWIWMAGEVGRKWEVCGGSCGGLSKNASHRFIDLDV